MGTSPDEPEKERECGDEDLPYPDSDLPPELQRTIKRKIDSGEDEGVDEDAFKESLRRAARPKRRGSKG